MNSNEPDWSYNEFLAFILVYSAGMNYNLSKEELEFIKSKTGIPDIDKIRERVNRISDAEAIETINNFKMKYLSAPESKTLAKRQLEELLKTDGAHSQLEKVAIHLIEKLI